MRNVKFALKKKEKKKKERKKERTKEKKKERKFDGFRSLSFTHCIYRMLE